PTPGRRLIERALTLLYVFRPGIEHDVWVQTLEKEVTAGVVPVTMCHETGGQRRHCLFISLVIVAFKEMVCRLTVFRPAACIDPNQLLTVIRDEEVVVRQVEPRNRKGLPGNRLFDLPDSIAHPV